MSKDNPTVLLYTTDDPPTPIVLQFGPGCLIKPKVNPNTGIPSETVTRISVGGGKEFSVKGNWQDIAKKAGYGDTVAEYRKDAKQGGYGDTDPPIAPNIHGGAKEPLAPL